MSEENNVKTEDKSQSAYHDFIDVTSKLGTLYLNKNHDYGNSFVEGMQKMGDVYVISRLLDKVNRLVTLSKKGVVAKVADETVIDTFEDIANYAIMALMYKRKQS